MMEKRFGGFRNRNGLHLSEKKHINNAAGRNGKGFTLVELIVVLVILAILAAIVVPVGIGFIDRAREKKEIANAEKAKMVTQTVLTEVYNGAGNRITHQRRQKALADSDCSILSKFKVWTIEQLKDGETQAVSDNIGSYTIDVALYTTEEEQVIFFDGKSWKIYKSIEELKSDSNVNFDKYDTGSKREYVINMWGYEGDNPRDTAYNPNASFDPGDEEWQGDEDVPSAMVKVRLLGSSSTLWFDGSRENTSALVDYYPGTIFNMPTYNVGLEYDAASVKWYPGGDSSSGEGISEDEIKAYLDSLDSTVQNVTLSAGLEPAYWDVSLSFEAKSNKLTVTNENQGAIKYNLKDKKFVIKKEVGDDKYEYEDFNSEAYANKVNCQLAEGVNGDVVRIGGWLDSSVEDPNAENAYMASVLNALGFATNQIKNWADAYLESGDMPEGSKTSFSYLACADITKTVYIQGKNADDIYFDGDINKKTKTLQFVQSERNPDTVKLGDSRVYSIENKTVVNGYSMVSNMSVNDEHKKLKSWTVKNCGKNKEAIQEANPEQIRFGLEQTIFERLFSADDANNYELAEIDVSNLTSRLAYTTLNENSPLYSKFLELADNDAKKINKIVYISQRNVTNPHKEICISSSEYKLEIQDNTLTYKPINIDWDYPAYVFAYSVSSGSGYDIYVYSEDGLDPRAEGNLKNMCANFTEMSSNTLVQHMETSSVTGTSYMFSGCEKLDFEHDSFSGRFSNATDMNHMFYGCKNLSTLNIGLDTKNVQNMSNMFAFCSSNSINANELVEIHVDSATDITNIFDTCSVTKLKLTGGGKSESSALKNDKVANAFKNSGIKEITFSNLNFDLFTGKDSGSGYKTTEDKSNGLYRMIDSTRGKLEKVVFEDVTIPNLETTNALFKDATKLSYIDLSGLSMTKNKSMRNMFRNTKISEETLKLGTFITDANANPANNTGIANMSSMLNTCPNLKDASAISGLDTSKVVHFCWMFENCTNLKTVDIRIDKAENFQEMFKACTKLETVVFRGEEGKGTTCPINKSDYVKDMYMSNATIKNFTIRDVSFSSITNNAGATSSILHTMLKNAGNAGMKKCELINVTMPNGFLSAKELFGNNGYPSLETITIQNVNFPGTTSLNAMIHNLANLQSVTLSNFSADHATDMSYMFSGCVALQSIDFGDGENVFNTSSATNMKWMFNNCNQLTNLDMTGFDVSKVTDFEKMFYACYNLEELDLSNFNTDKGTNFKDMFGTESGKISNLTTIYATNQFVVNNDTTAMFGAGLTQLKGGNETDFDYVTNVLNDGSNKYKSKYAKIDSDSTKGYFTVKQN